MVVELGDVGFIGEAESVGCKEPAWCAGPALLSCCALVLTIFMTGLDCACCPVKTPKRRLIAAVATEPMLPMSERRSIYTKEDAERS